MTATLVFYSSAVIPMVLFIGIALTLISSDTIGLLLGEESGAIFISTLIAVGISSISIELK